MLEKIVAAMPKFSINSISEDEQVEFGIYPHAVEVIVEAQCQLLAEQGYVLKGERDNYWWEQGVKSQKQIMIKQGYRKVPSEDELHEKVLEVLGSDSAEEGIKDLHRWLLEGE